MDSQYTADSLLAPLRRYLTKSQWQNLVVLVVALQLARTLILRQAALYMVCAISTASCYRRLERLLSTDAAGFRPGGAVGLLPGPGRTGRQRRPAGVRG